MRAVQLYQSGKAAVLRSGFKIILCAAGHWHFLNGLFKKVKCKYKKALPEIVQISVLLSLLAYYSHTFNFVLFLHSFLLLRPDRRFLCRSRTPSSTHGFSWEWWRRVRIEKGLPIFGQTRMYYVRGRHSATRHVWLMLYISETPCLFALHQK